MAWMARECQQILERLCHSPLLQPRVEGDGWVNWSGLAILAAELAPTAARLVARLLSPARSRTAE